MIVVQEVNKLLVVFKTHLDIGFTDFAENIRRKYMEEYIPAALKTAKELREAGGETRFVWTTGSWLINEYQESLSPEEYVSFEEQVRAGDIRWHALPCTTHTELMDAELFDAGIGISKDLDARFGVNTIACKMTDVPGHTRAIVPHLVKAGVEFMHIGVNPASAVPVVPPIFNWKSPTGESLIVMYHAGYGACSPLGNSGAAVYFAHAGDNLSPPSPDDICTLFSELHEKYPNAEIIASDLNAVAEILHKERDSFPEVTEEIGDSWIHGVGTDPGKVSMFRSLLRYRESIQDKKLRTAVNRRLLMICEHTWGLDEKTHLNDHSHFLREEFDAVRKTAPYQKMEQSWREQRAYIDQALSLLPQKEYAEASACVQQYRCNSVLADCKNCKELPVDSIIEIGNCKIAFNTNGAITLLQKDGKDYADAEHTLAQWMYTQLGPEDYERFFNQYICCDEEWALEDYDKIGMAESVDRRHDYIPKIEKLLSYQGSVVAVLSFDAQANQKYGCPAWVETTVTPTEKGIAINAAWFRKPANRRAEMLNLGFDSFSKDLSIHKLGEWMKPVVLENGNHNLHAINEGIRYPQMEIKSLDGALVSIGKPAILDFQNVVFEQDKVWFNLYNNQWGTNFPMWYEEDARFRYEINLF